MSPEPTSEVHKLAALYKDALQNRFPQYNYFLSISDHVPSSVQLRVVRYSKVKQSNMSILTAEFSPSSIEISYFADTGLIRRHVNIIDYADPKLTKDILSDILNGDIIAGYLPNPQSH